jgi:hypothetical protein
MPSALHRRPTLAQKVGAQTKDPLSVYDGLSPEQEDEMLKIAQEMSMGDFNPEVKGSAEDTGNFDELLSKYGEDASEPYEDTLARGMRDTAETRAGKVGSGEGMRGFNQFETPAEKTEKYGDIPEGVISDVMEPGNESEDVLYNMVEASSKGAEGGREGARYDVKEPKTGAGESMYDVLGAGGKPKAIIKEKTAVIPGGLAKNPFPEDSKLGRMFRAIEARGKPNGHQLGRVKRPRF